jgi:hypothetical protein
MRSLDLWFVLMKVVPFYQKEKEKKKKVKAFSFFLIFFSKGKIGGQAHGVVVLEPHQISHTSLSRSFNACWTKCKPFSFLFFVQNELWAT